MPTGEGLAVEHLSAAYDGLPVLHDVGFELGAGEIGGLLGPNGSGKTTLLRVLAGLEPATAGTVRLGGRPLDPLPAHRRGIGFVFQDPALFPGRTVAENVAYGLELKRLPPSEVDRRLEEVLDRLRLRGLSERRSEALSGGERQRVALARSLAPRPSLVLLDEPFASIDPELRSALRTEFRAALNAEGVGAVHVTHDPEEALAMADRLLLLRDGRLLQSGSAEEVFRRPADAAAARFLGYELLADGSGWVAVHPRELEPVEGGEPGPATLTGRITDRRPALGESWVLVERAPSERFAWRPRPGLAVPPVGAEVHLRPLRPLRYPGETGARDAPPRPQT